MAIIFSLYETIPEELIRRRGFLPNHNFSEFGLSVVELTVGDIVFDNMGSDNHMDKVPDKKLPEIDWNKNNK